MRLAFSTLACPGWTVEQAADAAVRFGYDGIEWRLADGHLLSPGTLREVVVRMDRAARDRGLAVACVDTSCSVVRDDCLAEAVAMAEMAAELGSPLIRVFGGAIPDGMSREEAVERGGELLRAIGARAGELGVRAAIETHDAWSAASDAIRLADAGQALVVWDVLHPIRAGETVPRTRELIGDRLGLVHLKDARGAELTLLGEGDLPLGDVVGLLAGYDGFVCVEMEKRWHPGLPEPEVSLPAGAEVLSALTGRRLA